jgi:DNA topoisomerase I
LTCPDTLARIRKLAIPPAYTQVWICPKPDGHIQATGRDAKGRKQYRYHTLFREIRDGTKFDHMLEFARALPEIRRQVDSHLALRGLPREKVLATIVHLLESTLIRVGNAHYAKQNKSFGLTTLQNRHVAITGDQLRFQFKGKSGKQWRLHIRDRRIARIVRAIQELPGQQLFQYADEEGVLREISSGDINDYLRAISGTDITAKDFRTWTGTVSAAIILTGFESAESKNEAERNLRSAIEAVSAQLGNTPTICRKSYIHPDIVSCYLDRTLTSETLKAAMGRSRRGKGMLSVEEQRVLHFLEKRTLKARAS